MMSGGRVGALARVVMLACVGFGLAGRLPAEQPFNVRLVGTIPYGTGPVDIVGHYAYLGGGHTVFTCDVSDPTSPSYIFLFYPLPGNWVSGIDVRDGLAYVADGSSGLQIVDVTNPSSPTLRGAYPAASYAWDVFVSGSLAYVACAPGLKIIDVTNPTSPTLRGSFDTPGFSLEVFVSGGLAYIADLTSLQIVDVTNPSSPVLRSAYPLDDIENVFVSDGVAYVTATGGTLYQPWGYFASIDVTNPDSPRDLAHYSTAGWARGVSVSGRYANVILGGGLRVFDISNPSSPALCGFYPLAVYDEGDWEVFTSHGLIYASAGGSVAILQFTGAAAANHWQLYR